MKKKLNGKGLNKPAKCVLAKKKSKSLGQSLVEYGLILALVSVVAITVLGKMGTLIKTTAQGINARLGQANAITQANST